MYKSFIDYLRSGILFEANMYTDEDVLSDVPDHISQAAGELDDATIRALVDSVKTKMNKAYDDYIVRKRPQITRNDLIGMWNQTWKEFGGKEPATTIEEKPKRVARELPQESPETEKEKKTKLWHILVQKLQALGGKPIPQEITQLMNVQSPTTKKDFEVQFVAPNEISNIKKSAGGQADVYIPFYRTPSGIQVSSNFQGGRYPAWHGFLSNVINNTPWATLKKVFLKDLKNL